MSHAAAPTPTRASAAHWRVAARAAGVRTIALGGAAAALAALQSLDPHRRMFVCPLRAVTGVPCPLCGGTTAAVRVGRLDVAGALAANPVVVIGAMLLAVAPVLLLIGVRRPVGRNLTASIVAALGVAQVWQLARLGVWPF